MSFDFSGATVLVTGGTSGIGLAIAKAFHKAGADAIAAGLASDPAVDEAIRREDLQVTDEASIERLMSRIQRLDVLVNAAGINLRDAEFAVDQFQKTMDVNLTGTMRMCMAARAKFAGQGAIVNFASMYSLFGAPRCPGYAASKGAVVQLTKSLAVAWAAEGIRVNAVAPGWVATPLTRALWEDPARSGAILPRVPMGRWATPEDIAGPVLFLCSPVAGFVTGAVLPVDGGYSSA